MTRQKLIFGGVLSLLIVLANISIALADTPVSSSSTYQKIRDVEASGDGNSSTNYSHYGQAVGETSTIEHSSSTNYRNRSGYHFERVLVALSGPAYTVSEPTGPAIITLTRLSSIRSSTQVKIGFTDNTATMGADYQGLEQLATFPVGRSLMTMTVPITNDIQAEGNEAFTVSIISATQAILLKPISAIITILDDDLGLTAVGGVAEYIAVEPDTGFSSLPLLGMVMLSCGAWLVMRRR